jgi:hypothetical protein
MPRWLRSGMVVVLGVMLGSSFTPALPGRSAAGADAVRPRRLCRAGGRRHLSLLPAVAGYGPITSFFTAMPGGLNEMVLVGGAMGGDPRIIALTHGARVMMVVFILVFGYFGDYHPTGGRRRSILHFTGRSAILAACGVVGVGGDSRLRRRRCWGR